MAKKTAGGRKPRLIFSVMHMKVMLGVRGGESGYRMPIARVIVMTMMLRAHSEPFTRKRK